MPLVFASAILWRFAQTIHLQIPSRFAIAGIETLSYSFWVYIISCVGTGKHTGSSLPPSIHRQASAGPHAQVRPHPCAPSHYLAVSSVEDSGGVSHMDRGVLVALRRVSSVWLVPWIIQYAVVCSFFLGII